MNSKLINFGLLLGSVLLLSACNSKPSSTPPSTSRADVSYSSTKPSSRTSSTPRADLNGGPFSHSFGSSDSSSISARTEAVFSSQFHSSGRRDGNGNTLHAIIVAATKAGGGIAESVKVDLKKMEKLVIDIADETKLSLTGGSISGNNFTRSNVMAAINGLSVKPGDVVWFYNASHGKNSGSIPEWPANSEWPAVYFPDDPYLPLEKIAAILTAKKPRLSIVMADMCNFIPGGARHDFARDQVGRTKNYQELFLNSKGSIMASASKRDQMSWGNSQKGGFFTYTFVKELNKELMVTDRRPSWKALMERVTKEDIPDAPEPQRPQAQVNVTQVNVTVESDWSLNCERNPNDAECEPNEASAPTESGDSSSPFSNKLGESGGSSSPNEASAPTESGGSSSPYSNTY